jgi:hypothetical protein
MVIALLDRVRESHHLRPAAVLLNDLFRKHEYLAKDGKKKEV